MPSPFVYQDVFGGSNIYPSDVTYGSVTLTSDTTYFWSLESAAGIDNLLPKILEVTVNSYKTPTFTAAGFLVNAAAIGDTSFIVSGDQTQTLPAGGYITADPITTPAPNFYIITSSVRSGANTQITISSGLLNNIAASTSLYGFSFVPWTITLPDATEAGLGTTVLFVSRGSTAYFAVARQSAAPNQILSVPPASAWQIYLTDNTTTGGNWQAFQYGAQTSSFQTQVLAGPGLTPYLNSLATALPVSFFSSNYSAGVGDRARTYVWTGGSGNFYLPPANTVGNNWFVNVRNQGSGVLNITPTVGTSDTINAVTIVGLDPGDSMTIVTDGVASFYSLGFGRAVSSTFNYTAIAVTGGDRPLAPTEQNLIAYRFYGTLTSNLTITVPQYIQQYWVFNDTSGNFTFTVRAAGGDTGQVVLPGKKAIYYCDGTRIVEADNNSIGLPLPVVSGGTGATTAAGALPNLGGSGLGIGVFTAVNTTAALTAIGSANNILAYLGVVNPSVGRSLLFSTTTASAITALGGASAVNQALGAASIGDILALAIALG